MGRREKSSIDDILVKVRNALENKGVSVINVEYQMINDRFYVDYECKECKCKGIITFKKLNSINNFKCEKCKVSVVNKVGSLEEFNEFGINYIDRNCDRTVDYYRGRLKRIWVRLRDSNKLSNEWLDYKEFESWSLSSGYKHWKRLKKIDSNDNSQYGIDNCHWVSETPSNVDYKISEEDTFVNRVRLMSVVGGECESIREKLKVINDAMVELESSKFISKGVIENVFDILEDMKNKSEELLITLDEIDIGRSRK